MIETKVGKTIKNNNGKEYRVIALNKNNKDRALLQGGNDFVIIDDLSYFQQKGSWGGGEYYPCFNDEDSSHTLLTALKQLNYNEEEETW